MKVCLVRAKKVYVECNFENSEVCDAQSYYYNRIITIFVLNLIIIIDIFALMFIVAIFMLNLTIVINTFYTQATTLEVYTTRYYFLH